MSKKEKRVYENFTLVFHNIPKENRSEVLGRAIIGLKAAGLNVQLDNSLRIKVDSILRATNGSFSAETFYQPLFVTHKDN